MNRLLLAPLIIALGLPIQVEAHPSSLEERAVDLVISKYDKQLKDRLKGTGKNPSYMVSVEEDCNVTIKAGTHESGTFSTMEWFDVNVCTKEVEKVCLTPRSGCE